MTDDLYMSAPESKSIKGVIEALTIFAKYTEKGINERYFCGAEHDELYIYVDIEKLTPESPDGQRLQALGFHPSSEVETWSYFT